MKNLFLFIALISFNLSFSQQWKEMADDINVNLYDVVAEAEAYFENIDITKKGSGGIGALGHDRKRRPAAGGMDCQRPV